ncbi:hypothetical protein DL1_21115 [Thioclava dalianensis]|uniref:Uncharacterized protein n=1 Tax=Thioclava dalianensis TaxID=1185766 RepID=A0A074TLW2_9RHOB|nr:hypothetical protein [Thioclava dalianensis]KEP69983.1 hypothetical protein DL1_21115 [Thioclava dalianensis]SFN18659.1 hypothetical protein SAMN05216224_102871 [Thioclava dalianensis]
MNNFEKRAEILGIAPDKAFAGKITVNTLDQLKELLNISGMPPSAEAVSKAAPSDAADASQSVAHAVARHVYGAAPLSDADLALAQSAFPLQLNVVSQPDKTINSEWNLNEISPDGPIVVSLGTLTIEDGGYIVVSNRALDFTVDTLVRNGSAAPGNDMGIFNILGITGAAGTPGDTPTAPGQATNGKPGNCSSAGIAGDSGGNGTTGTLGSAGGPGGAGGLGKPSLAATIRITTAVQSATALSVVTQSGAGGQGGAGGTGSKGGQGGNGGNGATCGCTGSAGGSGAQGGTGGKGGPGGQGGNGVDAEGDITIFAPSTALSLFQPIKKTAQPGAGGAPGTGGAGGDGGSAGSGGKHNSGGSGGGTGGQGETGTPGVAGTIAGQPADILIQPA